METQNKLPTYQGTDWHKYNLAKTNEKRLFYELLNELCKLIPEPIHENGRPPIPVKDMIFMSALKIYNNFSSRKIHHDIKEAELSGYIKKAPHYNRLSDFFNSLWTYDLLKKILTITAIPLRELEDKFSLDASGFGSYQYERWKRFRFSKDFSKRGSRNYLKGHICIGTRTNIVCTAEVTYGNLSDINEAPKLLEGLKGKFNVREVSADKGYSSKRICQIIESMGALPFVMFKDNSNPGEKSPEIWKRMYNYFKNNRENFLQHYHRRSNVESTFAMIKMKLGEFLKSKKYEAQRNELMMKFIVHNITCLVSEIFENQIHIDFKKAIEVSVTESRGFRSSDFFYA